MPVTGFTFSQLYSPFVPHTIAHTRWLRYQDLGYCYRTFIQLLLVGGLTVRPLVVGTPVEFYLVEPLDVIAR